MVRSIQTVSVCHMPLTLVSSESKGVCPPQALPRNTLLISGWALWFAEMKGQRSGLPLSLRPAVVEAPMTGKVTAGGSGHPGVLIWSYLAPTRAQASLEMARILEALMASCEHLTLSG